LFGIILGWNTYVPASFNALIKVGRLPRVGSKCMFSLSCLCAKKGELTGVLVNRWMQKFPVKKRKKYP